MAADSGSPGAIQPVEDDDDSRVHPVLREGPHFPDEADHPHEQVVAYGAYRGISPSEARRLLSLERRVPKLRTGIKHNYPAEFAGLYMNPAYIGEVVLLVTDNAESVRRDVPHFFERPNAVRVTKASNSYYSLTRTLQDIHNSYYGQDGLESLTSLWLDVGLNAVRAFVADGVEKRQREFDQRFGEGVVLVDEYAVGYEENYIPPSSLTCENNSRNGCNPLRGGIRIHRPNSPGSYCTSGFPSTDSGRHYLITAAHCQMAYPDMVRHHNWDIGGYVGPVVNEGNVDAVRLRLDIPQWGIRASYYRLSTSQDVSINSVFTGTFLDPGTAVCTSGVRTGWQCGSVLDSNVTTRNHTGMLGYTMCTDNGDSGAPVVNSYTAIAVHEGHWYTPNQDTGTCAKIGSWVRHVQNRLGTAILTR